MKIGNAQLAAVSAKSATTIRTLVEKVASLTQENTVLRTKLASVARDTQVSELAREMEDKGLNVDMTFEEQVAHLRGQANLENVMEAGKMLGATAVSITNSVKDCSSME